MSDTVLIVAAILSHLAMAGAAFLPGAISMSGIDFSPGNISLQLDKKAATSLAATVPPMTTSVLTSDSEPARVHFNFPEFFPISCSQPDIRFLDSSFFGQNNSSLFHLEGGYSLKNDSSQNNSLSTSAYDSSCLEVSVILIDNLIKKTA